MLDQLPYQEKKVYFASKRDEDENQRVSLISTSWTARKSLQVAIREISLPYAPHTDLDRTSDIDVLKDMSHNLEFDERDSTKLSLCCGIKFQKYRRFDTLHLLLFSDDDLQNWLIIIKADTLKLQLVFKLPSYDEAFEKIPEYCN